MGDRQEKGAVIVDGTVDTRWWDGPRGDVVALDCALVVTAVLATFTTEVVLWFHVIFVLLAVATLFLPMRRLLVRLSIWVPLVTLIVLRAALIGVTARSELIEIPLLGSILVIVCIGANHRESALRDLRRAKDLLEVRAREERDELRDRLDRIQQLEALGRLSLGIAHDFNNMLTALLGGAEELRDSLDGPLRGTAEELLRTAERGRALIDELAGYARQPELSLGECDLNEVTAGMEAMLRRLIPEHIELHLDLAANLAVLPLDRGRVGQVLVNLITNACDAIGARGRILVTTQDTHRVRAIEEGGSEAIDLVVLRVADDGAGIDHETIRKVFEPGFSTKCDGRNMGMGLASVRRIVESGGGSIDITSTPGRGTSVQASFPARAIAAAGASEPATLAELAFSTQ